MVGERSRHRPFIERVVQFAGSEVDYPHGDVPVHHGAPGREGQPARGARRRRRQGSQRLTIHARGHRSCRNARYSSRGGARSARPARDDSAGHRRRDRHDRRRPPERGCRADDDVRQHGAADDDGCDGNFRFDAVPQGRYEVHVAFEGFQPTTARLTVGGRPPSALRITLPLASLKQEVTVSNQAAEVSTGAATNSDAVTIDQAMLDSLPVFDQDLISTVSRFLDAGALGNGGATVVVNGMEVSALRVSASAVQQIKINQDPYSAEYARPGRGRIEILTKPGSSEYHGEANVFFRDAALDAQNAFAFTKPDDRKHIVEGTLGGPLGSSGKHVVHAVGARSSRGSAGVCVRRGPDRRDSAGRAAAEPAVADCREHHTTGERRRHHRDSSQLRVPRAARTAASAGRRSSVRAPTSSIGKSRSPTRSRRSSVRRS